MDGTRVERRSRLYLPEFVEASIFVKRVSKASTPVVTSLIVFWTSAAGGGNAREQGRKVGEVRLSTERTRARERRKRRSAVGVAGRVVRRAVWSTAKTRMGEVGRARGKGGKEEGKDELAGQPNESRRERVGAVFCSNGLCTDSEVYVVP
jgi:hypothetical protein